MKKNIFIVDDNSHVLAALTTALASGVWAVHGFDSKRKLEAYVEQTDIRPNLVLSDYSLEHGNTGLEVIEFVRRRYQEDIPALIISGVVSTSEINRIRDAGHKLLFKSSPPEDLIAEIDAAMC